MNGSPILFVGRVILFVVVVKRVSVPLAMREERLFHLLLWNVRHLHILRVTKSIFRFLYIIFG